MTCPSVKEMVEERIDRILTQYRESPKLLHVLRTYLSSAADLSTLVCDLPEKFDLLTAVGDQLTIVGKRLGWPRCHCSCSVIPVFGFDCEGVVPDQPVTGFCAPNSTWAGCGEFGSSDVCINDDEVYRKFLKVRVRQVIGDFTIESLEAAIFELWGPTAVVLYAGNGKVVICPGRDLNEGEISLLPLYPRILPTAPGIDVLFHFGSPFVFGFGSGWGGLCSDDNMVITAGEGVVITAGGDDPLTVGVFTSYGSPWMCAVDVGC